MLWLIVAFAFLSGAMIAAWLVRRITGRSGWIDTIWSAATGIAALVAILAADGDVGRKLAGAALVAIWSLRLATHIGQRSAASIDDPRYANLMAEWGPDADRRLFWFLQAQALAGFGLAVSVFAAVGNPAPFPSLLDWIALLVALVALAGEAIADRQLAVFRKSANRTSTICETGLWRYSRHPNYFFEWLWWCAWPLLAFSGFTPAPAPALSLLAPALMYVLLVHVSGIPPLEEHMVKSRGDAFRSYQRRVNAFFPGPGRR